jgi:uncharacterized protein
MNREILIKEAENIVKLRVSKYDSGHDWWHISRVRALASFINEKENMDDPFIVDLAALFHDYADSKFSGNNHNEDYAEIELFFDKNGFSGIAARITSIMKYVSFSSRSVPGAINDPVLKIIQDADKLDAMGAIGVARAFSYGGFRKNIIYAPVEDEKVNSTISHFYDKLLLLKSMMNTDTAREMAVERHDFLEAFLKQFFKEWDIIAI